MDITIFDGDIKTSDAQRSYITEKFSAAASRLDDPATVIEVRLTDINGPRGGVDKKCAVLVRSPGREPLRVEELAEDYYPAIDAASSTLKRLLTRTLEREKTNGPR